MKTLSSGLALAAVALIAGPAFAADAAMSSGSLMNAVRDVGHTDPDLGLTSVDNGMNCSGAGVNHHQDLSIAAAMTPHEPAGLALQMETDDDARTVFPDGGA